MSLSALVAGIGNPFFGDDGFGVEVARRLRECALPEGARVVDLGVGTLHLVFELMAGPELLLIIDTAWHGGDPGTLYLIEPESAQDWAEKNARPDAHGLDLVAVLGLIDRMELGRPRTWIIGCEPSGFSQPMELSEPVRNAVPRAVEMVREILAKRRHER